MVDETETSGLLAFEARLAVLSGKVRAGFPERASELRSAVLALGSAAAIAESSSVKGLPACGFLMRATRSDDQPVVAVDLLDMARGRRTEMRADHEHGLIGEFATERVAGLRRRR